jgi:ribosomal protein S18 acetylase RimI-like enzyme
LMNVPQIEVTPCSEEHLPELTELWAEYMIDQGGDDPVMPLLDLESSKPGFTKLMENYMRKEPEGFLVAVKDRDVVGFVVSFSDAFGTNYVTREKIGHIQVVHTKRGCRRQGVATKLIEAAEGYLRGSGCGLVLTETGEPNTAARTLLEKTGFRVRDKLIDYIKEL